ncbi:hypothetical protein D3C73_1018620 [compost metagenome]
MRNQEHRQEQQRNDKRIHHQAHGLDDRLFAATHHRQQAENQHKRQHRARGWRDVQLVFKETAHGVGQRHAVYQQDREDREKVQQGDQRTGLDAKVLFHDFGDVRAFAAGQYETGQSAVGVERHGKRQQRQDQQRPEAAQARIDRQKQGAGADGRAKQAQHPGGVMTIPAFKADRFRRCIAFADAIGLIIHPVGSPHSGRLLPGQDESEKPDRQCPGRNRGAIVRD